ncbi:MAG: polysaccharide deacetylase family protein [Tepidiformaceae bacterium]
MNRATALGRLLPLALLGLAAALAIVAVRATAAPGFPGASYFGYVALTAADGPPPPPPTPTPFPPGEPGIVISNGSRDSSMVALTLDMGGRVEPALDIVNWLLANQVHATIFMTGAMAENPYTEAGRDVLRIIEAHPATFELANHSYTHADFRGLTASQIADELARTERAMAPYASQDPRPLFRPPFGGWNDSVVNAVAAAGYPRVIMWDIDTIDWMPEAEGGPSTNFIVSKVLNNARGGSIVLMHLGGYNTFEALPRIVAGLRERGFQLVTVGEMLGLPR